MSYNLRRLTLDSLFLAVSMLLSYLEAILPLSVLLPLPGFKLGLANIAVLLLMFTVGAPDAVLVSLCRVSLSALLFGSPVSFLLSLGGACLSLICLFILKKTAHSLSFIGISLLSGAFHAVGQIAVAVLLFGRGTLAYLPVMMLASGFFGALCGTVANAVYPSVNRLFGRKEKP